MIHASGAPESLFQIIMRLSFIRSVQAQFFGASFEIIPAISKRMMSGDFQFPVILVAKLSVAPVNGATYTADSVISTTFILNSIFSQEQSCNLYTDFSFSCNS